MREIPGLSLSRRRERSRAAIGGTLLVLTALAGFSDVGSAKPWELLVAVLTASVISWLSDAYATFLSEEDGPGKLDAPGLFHAAIKERGLLTSAIIPAIPLLFAAVGPLGLQHAVWVSMALCVIELFLQGAALARQHRRGRTALIVSGAFSMGLAFLLVALKFITN